VLHLNVVQQFFLLIPYFKLLFQAVNSLRPWR